MSAEVEANRSCCLQPLGFVESPEQERDAEAVRWLCGSGGRQSDGGPCGPCWEDDAELQHLLAMAPSSPPGSGTSLLTPVEPQPFSCCAEINAQKENATPAFCFLPFRHRPQGFKDLHMCFT